MAGSKSDVFELELLKWYTGQQIASGPFGSNNNAPYLALFTVAPSESTAGTEASFAGYARVNTVGLWAAPASGLVQNSAAISFPAKTDVGSVTIVGCALMSGGTPGGAAGHGAGFAGIVLLYSDLRDGANAVTTKVLSQFDVFTLPAGAAVFGED